MEASLTQPLNVARSSTHPLILVAAASVTALSLAGVGVMAGWLPGPANSAQEAPRMAMLATVAPTVAPLAAPVAIQPVLQPAQEKPVATVSNTAPRAVASARQSTTRSVQATQPTPSRAAESSVQTSRLPAPVICADCGSIEAVNEIAVEPKGSGGGAIVGGILGGIAGNQVGAGTGRDLATIAGIVGGAFAGNHIEKKVKTTKRYDVVVRFEDGRTRTFGSETLPNWQRGDRVRLQNGALTEREASHRAADYRDEPTRRLDREVEPTARLGTI